MSEVPLRWARRARISIPLQHEGGRARARQIGTAGRGRGADQRRACVPCDSLFGLAHHVDDVVNVRLHVRGDVGVRPAAKEG